MQNPIEHRYFINLLARGFKLLEKLAEAGEPLTLSQVAEAMQMTLPTAYRFLYTLQAIDMIEKEPDRKAYRITPKVLIFWMLQRVNSSDSANFISLFTRSGKAGKIQVLFCQGFAVDELRLYPRCFAYEALRLLHRLGICSRSWSRQLYNVPSIVHRPWFFLRREFVN